MQLLKDIALKEWLNERSAVPKEIKLHRIFKFEITQTSGLMFKADLGMQRELQLKSQRHCMAMYWPHWEFRHLMSSPAHAQSNGQAERTEQI